MLRRHPIAAILAATAVLTTPTFLLAHARLVKSSPAANAVLSEAPAQLRLWFSERPETRFTSIHLRDTAGSEVALGAVRIQGDSNVASAVVQGVLKPGRFVVAWRTAAADGHPSSGEFSFTITGHDSATATPAPIPPAASEQPPKLHANAVVTTTEHPTVSTGQRWAELFALITIIGTIVLRLAVLPKAGWSDDLIAGASDRARSLGQAAIVLFVVMTITRIAAQTTLLPDPGASRFAAMRTVVTDTSWGQGWAVGAFGAVLAIVGLVTARRGLAGWFVAAIGSVLMAVGESLTGHAATSPHVALAVAADVSHLLAAGGWIGGLAALVISAFPSLNKLDDTRGGVAGSGLVRAYHAAAIECVVLIVLSAVISAWLRLPSLDALWLTQYGRLLLIKIGLVLVALGFGWFHWRTAVVPDWNSDTGFRFRRSAAFELIVGVAIVAVTSILISTSLPK